MKTAIAAALLVALSALGCTTAGFCPPGEGFKALACRNEDSREKLHFGMSKAEALAVMGEAEVRPPWANDYGLGPQVVRNPFDTRIFESPEGEEYEVLRYFVGLDGEASCPFVRGHAALVPLIFVDGELVGWRWSYMESVMQRRLSSDELDWSFGEFCRGTGDAENP